MTAIGSSAHRDFANRLAKARRGKDTVREVITHTEQTDLAEDDRHQIADLGQMVLSLEQRIEQCEIRDRAKSEITDMVFNMVELNKSVSDTATIGLKAANDRVDEMARGHNNLVTMFHDLSHKVATILSGQGALVKGVTEALSKDNEDEPLPTFLNTDAGGDR